MRVAYLDCYAGIAGDMFLGALLDAGVPQAVLDGAAYALGIGASLRVERVDRSGIACTRVHVLEGGQPAERHTHGGSTHEEHTHEGQGRPLSTIRKMIEGAALDPAVQAIAIRAFELLGASEARIHNVPIEAIHFHEVGAVDAIVDIVAASAGALHLGIDAWYSSAVNVGGGTVVCAHGTFPVPAPATADLLRGCPTYSAHIEKEMVTPTGAALLRALAPTFGVQPAMRVEAIGYGAGGRDPEGFPNALRLSVGESDGGANGPLSEARPLPGEAERQVVSVVETALDDLSPQVIAYVAEMALAQGALDVMLTPVVMKKGRPGTLVTILCEIAATEAMGALLLRETSTLGVRMRQERRICLERRHMEVKTAYGVIRVKVGLEGAEERNVAPEFEDCRAAAAAHGVPLKQVQQAALLAYFAAR